MPKSLPSMASSSFRLGKGLGVDGVQRLEEAAAIAGLVHGAVLGAVGDPEIMHAGRPWARPIAAAYRRARFECSIQKARTFGSRWERV